MTRIESLTPPLRPGAPWRAALAGGEALSLPESVVADFALYAGRELAEEELEGLRAAAFTAGLRTWTANTLSTRLLSGGQLREKLLGKGASPAQAEELLAWAEGVGLLSDRAYAEALVRHCQARGYGLYKIRDELYRRKVPRDLWEEALEKMEDPAAAIDRLLEKKLRDPGDRKQVKRASDALARRGFSWSEIEAGLRRALEGAEP